MSESQLRIVVAAVDVLTCIKKWNTRPTANLVQRKVQNALAQLEGDEEALCFLVESAFLKAGVRLDPPELKGVGRAVRGRYLTDAAEELAHVHASGVVVSEEAVAYARWQMSHALRIARECRVVASVKGLPLIPIATDLYTLATEELAKEEGSETEALKMVGVDGATVLDGLYLANEKGLLVGTTFCAPLTDQAGGGRDLRVCCGTCYSSIDARAKLSVCRRCGDHLFCEACLAGDGPARHSRECARVRSLVRDVARSMLPRVRESARRVAIVRLDEDGLVAPMDVKRVASPLVPSSLVETVLRAAPAEARLLAVIHWRLLVAFLA